MRAGYKGAGKLCYRHTDTVSRLQRLNTLLPRSCAGVRAALRRTLRQRSALPAHTKASDVATDMCWARDGHPQRAATQHLPPSLPAPARPWPPRSPALVCTAGLPDTLILPCPLRGKAGGGHAPAAPAAHLPGSNLLSCSNSVTYLDLIPRCKCPKCHRTASPRALSRDESRTGRTAAARPKQEDAGAGRQGEREPLRGAANVCVVPNLS